MMSKTALQVRLSVEKSDFSHDVEPAEAGSGEEGGGTEGAVGLSASQDPLARVFERANEFYWRLTRGGAARTAEGDRA